MKRKIANFIILLFIKIFNKADKSLLSILFSLIKDSYYDEKYKLYRKKYNISPSFRFNGEGILFYGEGELSIGNNSYIGNYSTISIVKGYKVIIGEKCSISHNVRMYTSTKIADEDFSKNPQNKYGNIIIEDFVWIGANVFIGPNIVIGKNSIIGANSVVTKNVDANSIVGGVPAKLIRLKKI